MLELLKKIKTWFEEKIPQKRLKNDLEGRSWFCKTIGYSDKFKLENLKKVTDRENLNNLYRSRFQVKTVKGRKGISAIKMEISMLYSFQKCFTQRYKGRMHFYRDDLSQKGKRNLCAVGQAFGIIKEFKQNLDS